MGVVLIWFVRGDFCWIQRGIIYLKCICLFQLLATLFSDLSQSEQERKQEWENKQDVLQEEREIQKCSKRLVNSWVLASSKQG